MTRYLMHYDRLSFLLCLLAVLHTSCNTTPDRRAFGLEDRNKSTGPRARSNSAPAYVSQEKQNSKEALCKLLLSALPYRGTQRIGLNEDPYSPEYFKASMQPIIENGVSARRVEYEYINQTEPILLVAIHYSKDAELVKYLLQKDAHQDLSKAEIQECLKAAVTNPVLEERGKMKEVLQLLIKAFKDSSDYFRGEAGSLDTLLTCCLSLSIPHLITALDENRIDVFGADKEGNTLPHRLCERYLASLESVAEWHEELLALPEARACLKKKNNKGKTPAELYPKRSVEDLEGRLEKGEALEVYLVNYTKEECEKLYNLASQYSLTLMHGR